MVAIASILPCGFIVSIIILSPIESGDLNRSVSTKSQVNDQKQGYLAVEVRIQG